MRYLLVHPRDEQQATGEMHVGAGGKGYKAERRLAPQQDETRHSMA